MKQFLLLLSIISMGTNVIAQKTDTIKSTTSADSLLNAISTDNKTDRVVIFKSSRMILSQSTETVKKKNLNFLIIHRFGDFAGANGGGKTYFGLDDVADVYLGFEYGISDNLNLDIGRTTIGGLADLELKYALIHQTADNSPALAITVIGETGLRPYGAFNTFGDRVSYFAQVLFARKLSSGLSLQVAPSFVRDNQPIPFVSGNDQQFFALSATARIKVSKHMGLIIDYAHPFSAFRQNSANGFTDPLGFGIEIETGGHVFTINITNSQAISEINYLSNTQSKYSRGEYRLGFTISRIFDFNRNRAK